MVDQITVRNVSKELARRLAKLAEASGRSINATVLELLERATGIDGRRARLERYITWSKADSEDFEQALREQRTIAPQTLGVDARRSRYVGVLVFSEQPRRRGRPARHGRPGVRADDRGLRAGDSVSSRSARQVTGIDTSHLVERRRAEVRRHG
jgi:hypothetical protein